MLFSIAYYIVCCEAVWSTILATAWLLVINVQIKCTKRQYLSCKGCIQVRKGAQWKLVRGLRRVGRDKEVVEVKNALPCMALVAAVDVSRKFVRTNMFFHLCNVIVMLS